MNTLKQSNNVRRVAVSIQTWLSHNTSSMNIIRSARADDDGQNKSDAKQGKEGDKFWEEIHEASANFVLFLVFLQFAGVILAGRQHKENLIKAMFTGKKKAEE